MGSLLLHNPWVQFYLLYVGALLVAFVWDLLRDARATRTPPDGATHTGAVASSSPPLAEILVGRCRDRRKGRIGK